MGNAQVERYLHARRAGTIDWTQPRFARRATRWLRGGMWSGRRCFIVGGGPSLRGADLAWLRHELVIGVNLAFRVAPVTMTLVGSTRLLVNLVREYAEGAKRQWLIAPETILLDMPNVDHGAWALPVVRDPWGTSIREGVATCTNTGLQAINLADILGAETIYLLGFDGKPGHFHDEYPKGWIVPPSRYDVYRTDIEKRVTAHAEGRVVRLDRPYLPELVPADAEGVRRRGRGDHVLW